MSQLNWIRTEIQNVYLGLYDGPHATPKPSKNGPIFLGIKNLTEDGNLNLSQVRHIAEEPADRRRTVRGADTCGTPGTVARIYAGAL